MAGLTPRTWQDAAFLAFTTFWASRTGVGYPNLDFDETLVGEDAAWVQLFVLNAAGGQVPVGPSAKERPVQRTGKFTVEVLVRGNKGTALAYDLADAALLFFQNQLVPATVFSALGLSEIGGDPWWQVNATADFMYLSDRAA